MDSSQKPTSPAVTIEWDKNEKQRTRNRINQRNYRRRKSEQQKENNSNAKGKHSVDKSCKSSGTPSICAPDTQTESEHSPRRESSASPFPYNFQPSSWHTSTAGVPQLDTMLMPTSLDEGGTNCLQHWMTSTTDMDRIHSMSRSQELPLEDWHTANNFNTSPDLTGISPQVQPLSWSQSPLLGTRPNPNTNTILKPPSNQGKTTLHLAAENGHAECVQVLLFHSADPNLIDLDGNTPLHLAAQHGHKDVIATLIDHQCNFNAITSSGKTALHLAVENNHFEVVDQLLRAGCDPNNQI